jgi:putative oxidoreductase
MESIDIGLLAIRLVVGTLVLGHGFGNLFGWLGGFGLAGTGEIFERFGFRPGRFYAGVAGLAEVGAGALLVAGLATPLAAAAVIGVMVNTIFTAHRGKGPWYFNGGWEYNVTLVAVAAALGFAGPGTASLDDVLDFRSGTVGWGLAALGAGLVSGAAVLVLARRDADAGPSVEREAA